jgi:hypothetical protein
MNFTYSHGCILNETRRIVVEEWQEISKFFPDFPVAFLHQLLSTIKPCHSGSHRGRW